MPEIRVSRELQKTGLIFVFGSNLAGRHGAGAALTAKNIFGARSGVGFGPTGHCYAIPTKDFNLKTISLKRIAVYINAFKKYAKENPGKIYYVTKVGCGLAGYSDEDIAPLFSDSPENCVFHLDWHFYLGDSFNYYTGHIQ